jgi:hypothetical protein
MKAIKRAFPESVELISWLLVLLLWFGLAQNWSWLLGSSEWHWGHSTTLGMNARTWRAIGVCIGLGYVIYCLTESRTDSMRWRGARVLSLVWIAASLAIQIALVGMEDADIVMTLAHRTVSTASGGYFNVASRITDVGQFLREYPKIMPGLELHPSSHPPGLPMLFWAATNVLHAWPALANALGNAIRCHVCTVAEFAGLSNAQVGTAVLQMSTPIWAALTVLPLASLAKRLYGEATARRGLVFFIFTPSLALWATRWNQFFAFLAVSSLYLVQRGLDSRRSRWFFFAGTMISFATFLDLANIPIGCISLLYWGLHWANKRRKKAGSLSLSLRVESGGVVAAIGWGIGVVSIWAGYYLALDVSFLEILQTSMSVHTSLHRSYSFWLGYNLFDFFLYLGIPISVVLGRALTKAWRARTAAVRSVPFLAFWICLILLDGSGIVRGQAARLWLFLVPLAYLAAMPFMATLSRRSTAILLAAQVTQVLVCGNFVRPINTGLAPCVPSTVACSRPPDSRVMVDDTLAYSPTVTPQRDFP